MFMAHEVTCGQAKPGSTAAQPLIVYLTASSRQPVSLCLAVHQRCCCWVQAAPPERQMLADDGYNGWPRDSRAQHPARVMSQTADPDDPDVSILLRIALKPNSERHGMS